MREVLVACWALVACGGTAPAPKLQPRAHGKHALHAAVTDEKTMLRLLHPTVINAGLWFDDADCRAKFPPGEVGAAKLRELARCLVALKLQPSTRESALGDVHVLTYPPGFEVEARVVTNLGTQARLTWIGPSALRAQDKLPTISGDALESRRLAGKPDGPVDDDVAKAFELDQGSAFTWFKICLDATGAITSAEPYMTTSSKVEKAFVAAVQSWKFRPFVIRDQPVPVCAMSRLVYPPGSRSNKETLPHPPPLSHGTKRPLVLASGRLLEGHRIAGTRNVVPIDVDKYGMQKLGLTRVEGTFRLCVDDQGIVESVLPMRPTGIAGYDARIMTAIRAWRYRPYTVDDQVVPVCAAVTFVYSQSTDTVKVRRRSR
jgi:hypothetical protein